MWGGEFVCEGLKQSLNSPFPWDIPWCDPGHAVFFTALYGALSLIGIGLVSALILTIKRLWFGNSASRQ